MEVDDLIPVESQFEEEVENLGIVA